MRVFAVSVFVLVLAAFLDSTTVTAGEQKPQPPESKASDQVVGRALQYLRKMQANSDPAVERGLRWLRGQQAKDQITSNTTLTLLALKAAGVNLSKDAGEPSDVQIRSVRITSGVVEIRGNVIRSEGGKVEIILQGKPR